MRPIRLRSANLAFTLLIIAGTTLGCSSGGTGYSRVAPSPTPTIAVGDRAGTTIFTARAALVARGHAVEPLETVAAQTGAN